jgi:hypothetical protein
MTAQQTQSINQWRASMDHLRLIARRTFHLLNLALQFQDSMERQSALALQRKGNGVVIDNYLYWTNRLHRESLRECQKCRLLLSACADRIGEHLEFLDEYELSIRAADPNKIWELKNAVLGSEMLCRISRDEFEAHQFIHSDDAA